MCAVMELHDAGVMYPFMLREVPIAADHIDMPQDITGPLWGYTGAFAWNVNGEQRRRFGDRFDGWARERSVVSSFTRLSLFPEQILPAAGRIRVIQPNVIRELQLSDDELWRDVDHKVRKNVNRARSAGVVVEHDVACARLDEFSDIYTSTMERRDAADAFRFDLHFFTTLAEELGQALHLFVARVDSNAISAELVLTSTHHGYSFLGGTRAEAFGVRPGDLLKFEIIRSLRDQGLTHFVLGGGPTPGDGIFRYKRSFAPGGVVDFTVSERILDRAMYDGLIAARSRCTTDEGVPWEPDPAFFPAYRSPGLRPCAS